MDSHAQLPLLYANPLSAHLVQVEPLHHHVVSATANHPAGTLLSRPFVVCLTEPVDVNGPGPVGVAPNNRIIASRLAF